MILLHCLSVVILLPFIILVFLAVARKNSPGYDINAPRHAQLTGWGQRCYWAHFNAYEALAYFTPVVMISLIARADTKIAGILGIVFVICRILHFVFYLLNWGWLRFGVFSIGILSCIGLLVLSYMGVR